MMPMKSAPGVSVEWYTDRCVSLVFSYWVWFRFFFGLMSLFRVRPAEHLVVPADQVDAGG